MRTRIVGIDCAVSEQNVAVAVGDLEGEQLVVHDSVQCGVRSAVEVASAFLAASDRTLITLDAPLGWPAALGSALVAHRAGYPISPLGHGLFRRRTDIVVKNETGQQPLDVGADRIARTAVAALALLESIRLRFNVPISLAWDAEWEGVRAIEVYPAATLKRLGASTKSYKKREQREARAAIFETLRAHAEIGALGTVETLRADAIDAAVCVLAGADFLLGRCRRPNADEWAATEQEGWIWVRAK